MADQRDPHAGAAKPRAALDKTLRGLARRGRRASDWVTGHKPVQGFVDRVLASEVLGWAFDPNKPNRRVHIIATLDGQIIAETLADLPRRDLDQHGKGDGRHGFNLRIPAAAGVGGKRVRIEALLGRRQILLKGGEILVPRERTLKARKPEPRAPAPVSLGALEKIADGQLHGWVPASPKGGPVVVDIYDDERYLGSVNADKPRPKLQSAAPGAKGFSFPLPSGLDLSLAKLRARANGGAEDLRGFDVKPVPTVSAKLERAATARPGEGIGLLVFDTDTEDAVRRTTRSWADQTYKAVDIGRIRPADGHDSEEARDNTFGPGKAAELRRFVTGCHTLAFVRPGETLDPQAARILASAHPAADVLTWDITDQAGGPQMRRRSEAWPLALMLGGSLGGSFALRSAVAARLADEIALCGTAEGLRNFELALAGSQHLRWAHLPASLSAYARDKARPPRLEPGVIPPPAKSVTLAIWPGWSDDALASLQSLAKGWDGAQVEVLVPAKALSEAVSQAIAECFTGSVVSIRPIDLPEGGGSGAILRTLGEAALGEAVLFARAGLSLESGQAPALAAWALSPLVGAVTGRINTQGPEVSGVSLHRSRNGWRVVSAFDPSRAGISRPVLACPASLMAVSRAKLAAVGGIDARRFPIGADLDLCLRLRGEGWTSMVLGGVTAATPATVIRRDADLALAFREPAELAAAAAAYPALDDPRERQQP